MGLRYLGLAIYHSADVTTFLEASSPITTRQAFGVILYLFKKEKSVVTRSGQERIGHYHAGGGDEMYHAILLTAALTS